MWGGTRKPAAPGEAIERKISPVITCKGYTVRASEEDPQYLIKNDTADHLAMHKGSALEKLKSK